MFTFGFDSCLQAKFPGALIAEYDSDDRIFRELQKVICMHTCNMAVLYTPVTFYPLAIQVITRAMIYVSSRQGACEAAIMSEESMSYGFNGDSNKWDCGELDKNAVTGYDSGAGVTATAESGMCSCATSETSDTLY